MKALHASGGEVVSNKLDKLQNNYDSPGFPLYFDHHFSSAKLPEQTEARRYRARYRHNELQQNREMSADISKTIEEAYVLSLW